MKKYLLKSRIEVNWRNESRNLSHVFLYFFIFIFGSMNDRPTDKVNYKPGTYWDIESYLEIQPYIMNSNRENDISFIALRFD